MKPISGLFMLNLCHCLRQTSGSNMNPIFGLSSSKNSAVDRDIVCVQVSTNKRICTSQIPHLVAFVFVMICCVKNLSLSQRKKS